MLNGFILVDDIVRQEEYTSAGIYIGENNKDIAPVVGTIIASHGAEDSQVVVGDKVLFKEKASIPVIIDGKKLNVIDEKSLMGIIRG
jgi:co-chaperonin GroES (HSP10)